MDSSVYFKLCIHKGATQVFFLKAIQYFKTLINDTTVVLDIVLNLVPSMFALLYPTDIFRFS